MKEIYLKHYWVLYMEFIEAFKKLTYQKIPLPLLANFYQYIPEDLKQEMYDPGFRRYLKQKYFAKESIQPYFDSVLKAIKVTPMPKQSASMTLLNYDYLRFPAETYQRHFRSDNTAILMRNKPRIETFEGLPIHTLGDYYHNTDEKSQELVKKAEKIFSTRRYRNHYVFGQKKVQQKFLANIPLMVQQISAIEKLLNNVPVSTIVVGTAEDIISRTLAIKSLIREIPSICMQHGAIMGEEAFLPVFTTNVAVYGEYEKNWYMERGLQEQRINVIGHPRYDNIFIKEPISKETFLEDYGLDEQKKQILVITHPIKPETCVELVEELVKTPSFEIIIKPHPWEIGKKKCASYVQLSEKYKQIKVLLSRKENLYDILPNVDVVIIGVSTVGLEAMLFGKPVFVLRDKLYRYYDQMGKFSIEDAATLSNVITTYFEDEQCRLDVEEQRKLFLANSYPQKLSGEKLIDLIKELTM